jgi:hypothetical protein
MLALSDNQLQTVMAAADKLPAEKRAPAPCSERYAESICGPSSFEWCAYRRRRSPVCSRSYA